MGGMGYRTVFLVRLIRWGGDPGNDSATFARELVNEKPLIFVDDLAVTGAGSISPLVGYPNRGQRSVMSFLAGGFVP
ncbi:hypothetical protein HerbRD11066_04730 [Herbidospora sp. RD11066]